jgi:hypothetical protein
MVVPAIALGLVSAVRAQTPTGQVGTQAVVVTVGMSLTPLTDLRFGSIPLGIATTVAPTEAGAGFWSASGSANAFVAITFTLPAALNNIQAVPGVTMPITFGNAAARWRRASNDPAGASPFNPAVGAQGRFGPPPNPTLYIWIGGTVNPAAAQLPGIYTGSIVLQLAYL